MERLSFLDTASYVNAAAGLSSHGFVVLFSHGAVCYCRGWAGESRHGCLVKSRHEMFMPRPSCLVTAHLACVDTARYGNGAAGLSSRGFVVLSKFV